MALGFFQNNVDKLNPFYDVAQSNAIQNLGSLQGQVNANLTLGGPVRRQILNNLQQPLQPGFGFDDPNRQNYVNAFIATNRAGLDEPLRQNLSFANNLLSNAGMGNSSINQDAQMQLLKDYSNKYGQLAAQGNLLYDEANQANFGNRIAGLQALANILNVNQSGQNDVQNAYNALLTNKLNAASNADNANTNFISGAIGNLANIIANI